MHQPGVLIISDDDALAATLGGKLEEWGAKIVQLGPERPSLAEQAIDVVFIDIRQDAAGMLGLFNGVRSRLPFAEVVLINRSGSIGASMQGMRAGASDELIVPFDTKTLRKVLEAAWTRSRKRQKKGRSLIAAIERTMNAAVFAQAGEFATALEMLNGPETAGTTEEKER